MRLREWLPARLVIIISTPLSISSQLKSNQKCAGAEEGGFHQHSTSIHHRRWIFSMFGPDFLSRLASTVHPKPWVICVDWVHCSSSAGIVRNKSPKQHEIDGKNANQ